LTIGLICTIDPMKKNYHCPKTFGCQFPITKLGKNLFLGQKAFWLSLKTILVTTQKKKIGHCPENFSCSIDGGSILTSVLMNEIFLSLPKKV
jgi:hypothetical protein